MDKVAWLQIVNEIRTKIISIPEGRELQAM